MLELLLGRRAEESHVRKPLVRSERGGAARAPRLLDHSLRSRSGLALGTDPGTADHATETGPARFWGRAAE